ncbi:type II secretion system protein [Kiritimatiellaeota bacterium B1221]|nr:type II secretion system protein [Kiritimatiellaeota bacterium B1221]
MSQSILPYTPAVKKEAFTLIEMLVVIAIIAVLSSLLLSVIQQTRQKAMDVNCKSNIRESMNGLLAYASEHESGVPAVYKVFPPSNGTWRSWAWVLESQGYMTDYESEKGIIKRRAYSCPLSAGTESQVNNGQELTYGINSSGYSEDGKLSLGHSISNIPSLWPGTGQLNLLMMMRIEKPSNFILLGESFSKFYMRNFNREMQAPVIGGENASIWLRHDGHANVGFADGRVGEITAETGPEYLNYWKTWLLTYYPEPE